MESSAQGDAPSVIFDAIPAALRDRAQWLLWRFEPGEAGKKPRKMPYYVDGGRRAGQQGSAADRKRLAAFDRVRTAYGTGGWSGIGFAFLPDDGLFGIDIDAAIDRETGEVNPRAQAMIAACDSWAELSPSGLGAHIFMRGVTETHKVNSADGRIGVEIFAGRQFFTVTGHTWPGAPAHVREAGQKLLAKLHRTVDSLKADARPAPTRPASLPPSAPAPAGADDFARVNAAALANLQAWVEQAVPGGRWYGRRYRVSSKALGRDLQEDLSIDPAGIQDFGAERGAEYGTPGMTAIDVVVEFMGKTPREALHWLAERLGVTLTPPPSRRRAAKGRPAPDPIQQPAGGDDPPPSSTPNQQPPGGDDPPPPDDDGGPFGRDDGGRKRWWPLCNDDGRPRPLRENVFFALMFDPKLAGLVAGNLFTLLIDKTRVPPWGGHAGEWEEIDDLLLAEYLSSRYRLALPNIKVVQEGVRLAARRNEIHPLRDWLNELGDRWDGKARLDTWLQDYLGVEDGPYTRLTGRMYPIGMVARVFRPGCKMDYALILQGAQGLGKSAVLRALAEPYFADTVFKIGDKDAMMSVQGVWVYELSELDALSKAEHTAAKAFIASQEDRFRLPYGSKMTKAPRRSVLAGTTNPAEFLNDPTGDRRYWPVHVTRADADGVRAVRDQLLGEAVALFRRGERWWPTLQEEKTLFWPQQDRFKSVDVWADILEAYVNSDQVRDHDESGQNIPMNERLPNCERDWFSTHELLVRALRVEPGRIDNNRQMQRRVANAMTALGWQNARDPANERRRGYARPSAEPAPAAPSPNDAAGSSPPAQPSPDDRARAALKDADVAF